MFTLEQLDSLLKLRTELNAGLDSRGATRCQVGTGRHEPSVVAKDDPVQPVGARFCSDEHKEPTRVDPLRVPGGVVAEHETFEMPVAGGLDGEVARDEVSVDLEGVLEDRIRDRVDEADTKGLGSIGCAIAYFRCSSTLTTSAVWRTG